MTRLRLATNRTFLSLRTRNYRLYFTGQVVSSVGTWMQEIAQTWLVLQMTRSGVAIGLLAAVQFLPVLVGGAWGGLVADRVDKRRLVIGTQTAAGILALVLGVITVTGVVRVWMVFALALGLGLVTMLDNPARRAFVFEMVGPEHVPNAVGLSSGVYTLSRVAGPALAGILITLVGVGVCFLVNAVSYVAAIAAFVLMRPEEFYEAERVPRERGQLREGFAYVRRTPALLVPLAMVALIGTFAYNFRVVLPLMAERVFGGDAALFSSMYSTMSAGAVVGALGAAHHSRTGRTLIVGSALVFGAALAGAAVAPVLSLELALLVVVGGAGVLFTSSANSVLMLEAAPEMRGRVMALYTVAFLGSTPVGAPIVGAVSQSLGARAGLGLGAAAALTAAAVAAMVLSRRRGHGRILGHPTPADRAAA